MQFDPNCKKCPRLANFLDKVSQSNPDYHCRPVAPFGDMSPQFLIVGLAPGMHGANKTGRPFTGDYAGILLYETLSKFGFSSSPESISLKDGLQLFGVRITNAVKCLPPENKPTTSEIKQCNNYLATEIKEIKNKLIILALGKIAHEAVLTSQQLTKNHFKFSHGARHIISDQQILYDSYHCSRYNTQTKRLTQTMFEDVIFKIKTEMEN